MAETDPTYRNTSADSTCGEVDHGGGACCDGVHLGVDLVFGLVHLVFAPGLGRLRQGQRKSPPVTEMQNEPVDAQNNASAHGIKLTASVPSGGRVSKSSREAWAAWTACILELMVPVRAC